MFKNHLHKSGVLNIKEYVNECITFSKMLDSEDENDKLLAQDILYNQYIEPYFK
jgi:hypothetical protein